jgi:siroheme synthase-like protein
MNPLFPIFLKAHQLNLLIVGGGNVAEEKLGFLLKGSPEARVTVVGTILKEEVRALAEGKPNVVLHERPFSWEDLDGRHIVICATDDRPLHEAIKQETEKRGILTNVADTPELCDFYLGGVVTKGDLKIAISTNGKSPTLAKRIRQYLEEALPDDTQSLIDNLRAFRSTLKGDFAEKVREMNEVTASLLKK